MADNEKIKVLLIDDDESFYELFKAQMEKFEIELQFDHKNEVPNDSSIHEYDVIFVDNMFYGQPKAVEFIAELHSKAVMADVIVISGYGDMSLLKELINIGIAGYIDKDEMDTQDIRDLFKNAMERKKIIRRIRTKILNFN